MDVEIPQLAWPLEMAGRELKCVEQDGIEDVQQNVRSYLSTPRSARYLSPDFGVEDPTFGPGIIPERLAAEIMTAEDRASVTVTATGPDQHGRQSIQVVVDLAE